MKEKIIKIIDEVRSVDHISTTKFRNGIRVGWEDACDVIKSKIEAMPDEYEWVKVDEMPLENGKPMIVYGVNEEGKNRVLSAYFIHKFWREGKDNFEGISNYDDKSDRFYWPQGWYESNEFEETTWLIDFEITHCMQLPKPPKK